MLVVLDMIGFFIFKKIYAKYPHVKMTVHESFFKEKMKVATLACSLNSNTVIFIESTYIFLQYAKMLYADFPFLLYRRLRRHRGRLNTINNLYYSARTFVYEISFFLNYYFLTVICLDSYWPHTVLPMLASFSTNIKLHPLFIHIYSLAFHYYIFTALCPSPFVPLAPIPHTHKPSNFSLCSFLS